MNLVVDFVVFVVVLAVVGLLNAFFMKQASVKYDLRTLPVSLSGILLGVMLAVADYHVDLVSASALLMSAILIHLYMASESKWFLLASVVSAALTVFLSYGTLFSLESLILLLFSYFVLRLAKGAGNSGRVTDGVVTGIVKGPVALIGAYFVCSHSFGSWVLLFPAMSIGLLCVAAHGLEDGYKRPFITLLVLSGISLMVAFSFMRMFDIMHFLYVLAIPLFIVFIVRLYTVKGQAADCMMSSLALYILAFSILTGIGFIAYLF